MASLTQQASGWTLQFYGPDKRKRSIWIGNTSIKKADAVKRHVEEILEARMIGVRPNSEAVKWVMEVEQRIRDLQFEYGMIDPQTTKDIATRTVTCKQFMDAYIEDRQHVSDKWRVNFRQAQTWFFKHIAENKLLVELLESDCQAWHEWMLTRLKPTTAGQHVKRCRQMLKAAVQSRQLDRNPLAGLLLTS